MPGTNRSLLFQSGGLGDKSRGSDEVENGRKCGDFARSAVRDTGEASAEASEKHRQDHGQLSVIENGVRP